MPGLWKTLRRSLADSYDYLGLVVLCSSVWFTVILGSFALWVAAHKLLGLWSIALPLGLYILLISPTTAGVFVVARKIVARDDPSPPDLLSGFRRFLTASWSLAFVQVILTALICTNAWFYLSRGSVALKLVGVLFVYVLLLWALSGVYHYPILVEQHPGAWRIIKRGFLLTVASPFFTAGVFSAIILLTCLSMLIALPLPLLYIGVAGVIQTSALRVLYRNYGLIPPEREHTTEDEASRAAD